MGGAKAKFPAFFDGPEDPPPPPAPAMSMAPVPAGKGAGKAKEAPAAAAPAAPAPPKSVEARHSKPPALNFHLHFFPG